MAAYAALVEDEIEDESELELCAAQAESALAALSRVLVGAEAVLASEAAEVQAQLRNAAQAAEAARRACRELELEAGGSADAASPYRAQQIECSRRLQRLLGTLDFLRKTRQRELLLNETAAVTAGGSTSGGGGGKDPAALGGSASELDKMSPATLIALGAKVQNESAASVARMTRLVEASRQLGTSTLETLGGQRSRLERVRDTATAQAFQFELAEKELADFTSFAFADGTTVVLLILIALGLVIVGTWELTVSDSDSTSARGREGAGVDGWCTEVYSALDPRSV